MATIAARLPISLTLIIAHTRLLERAGERIKMSSRNIAMLGLAASITTASIAAPPMFYSRGQINPQVLIGEVLASHNVERRRVGLAPLAWDPALAEGARIYANQLAPLNLLRHSPKAVRRGIGENLWMGTSGYFRPSVMVGAWASERSMFRPAAFPDVSTTGNWADVGHYTQMIWPATRRVGCAISKSVQSDILVCRYWPSGNVTGQRVP
jgi:hypothetical protein